MRGKTLKLREALRGDLKFFFFPDEPVAAFALNPYAEISGNKVRRLSVELEAIRDDRREKRGTASLAHADVVRVHRKRDNLKITRMKALKNGELLRREVHGQKE